MVGRLYYHHSFSSHDSNEKKTSVDCTWVFVVRPTGLLYLKIKLLFPYRSTWIKDLIVLSRGAGWKSYNVRCKLCAERGSKYLFKWHCECRDRYRWTLSLTSYTWGVIKDSSTQPLTQSSLFTRILLSLAKDGPSGWWINTKVREKGPFKINHFPNRLVARRARA